MFSNHKEYLNFINSRGIYKCYTTQHLIIIERKNEPSLVRGSHFWYKLIYKSGKIFKLKTNILRIREQHRKTHLDGENV